jgi:FkbM family methyltransferase
MSFVTRNEDVFQLSGDAVTTAGPISISESQAPDGRPVMMEVVYHPVGNSSARAEIIWNRISKARLDRGELVDFHISISRIGDVQDGDRISLKFFMEADRIWDPVFATIGAASFKSDPKTLLGAEIGFGAAGNLHFAVPVEIRSISHMATGYRFEVLPDDPYFELRLHLKKASASTIFHVGRVFGGLDYDPYIYNPKLELIGHRQGRASFSFETEAKQEFEVQAREAAKCNKYLAMQSFIRPFVVCREGTPRFPMLVGTPNSISWYAIEPQHGIEVFAQEGFIEPGDVTLDCGAHAGQMAALFALVGGDRGKVFAFDPFPQNYLQIEAQKILNDLRNLHSMRVGVGDRKSKIVASILGQQTTSGGNHSDEIKLDIVPLDDYISCKPTFIKLDVEGAEVAALRGAQKLLRDRRPRIFVEVHTQYLAHFGHTLTDLFDAIPANLYHTRFKIEGVDREWRDYEPGAEQRVTVPMLVWATPR